MAKKPNRFYIYATLELSLAIPVESNRDPHDLSDRELEEFIDELTPYDWFDHCGAERPSIGDIEVDPEAIPPKDLYIVYKLRDDQCA